MPARLSNRLWYYGIIWLFGKRVAKCPVEACMMSATLPPISSTPHSMTPAVTSFGVSPQLPSPTLRKARISIVSASMPNLYDVYPPRLPLAGDIPAKVNPTRPLPPFKMTTSHETVQPTTSNHYRTMRLKQRDHYRFHSVWSKYFYGSVADKQQQGSVVLAWDKEFVLMELKVGLGLRHLCNC